jgi:hypothetical protein
MIVKIVRAGGYAGIEQPVAEVDTTQLDDRVGEDIRRALEDVASAATGEAPIGADLQRFEIDVIGDGGLPRHMTVHDEGDPTRPPMEKLQRLLRLVGGSA